MNIKVSDSPGTWILRNLTDHCSKQKWGTFVQKKIFPINACNFHVWFLSSSHTLSRSSFSLQPMSLGRLFGNVFFFPSSFMIFLSGKMNKKPPKTQPKTCWIAHQLFLQINSAFCCMESLKTIGKEYFKTSSFFHCKFLFSYPVHPYCVHLTSIKTKDQTSGICVTMSIEWWKVLYFFFYVLYISPFACEEICL